jgi:hypothetical protein
MDPDFRLFVLRHLIDIVLIIIFGVKVLFVSKANFKTKIIGAVLIVRRHFSGSASENPIAGWTGQFGPLVHSHRHWASPYCPENNFCCY